MGALRHLIESHREEIPAAVRRHKGCSVAIFGSVARGDESAASDVDFLVEFEPGSSLFDLMDLEDELAEILGVSVDVVSAGGSRIEMLTPRRGDLAGASRSDAPRVQDVLEACEQFAGLVSIGEVRFNAEVLLQRAAERLLEIHR